MGIHRYLVYALQIASAASPKVNPAKLPAQHPQSLDRSTCACFIACFGRIGTPARVGAGKSLL